MVTKKPPEPKPEPTVTLTRDEASVLYARLVNSSAPNANYATYMSAVRKLAP